MSARLDTRLNPARADLADERLRGAVDALRYVAGVERRLVAPSAPIRREPRDDAPLDTEALLGEAVTLYDERDGYAWVQLARDRYVGYAPSGALGPAGPRPTHRVAALRTFVYPAPNLKTPTAVYLSMGAGVIPIETDGAFVRLDTGGYVFAGHLAAADAAEPDYVSVAERLLGAPYLWGGKTSLGLDCSGLVQLSLAMAGIVAPRDADMQQAALGEPIAIAADLSGLRRGDLVFWRGHVGIMQDASRLLHANGHHMAVASEDLAGAERRIREKSYGPITEIRRLTTLGGG